TANPVLLLATALWTLHPSIRRLCPKWTQVRLIYLYIVPAVMFGTLFLVYFAVATLESGGVPARVETWFHMVWFMLWFLTMFAWSRGAGEERSSLIVLQ